MKVYVKFNQIAQETREKHSPSLYVVLLVQVVVFLMSQASYNLVTSVPMLIP